jgi:hypothetical protein
VSLGFLVRNGFEEKDDEDEEEGEAERWQSQMCEKGGRKDA